MTAIKIPRKPKLAQCQEVPSVGEQLATIVERIRDRRNNYTIETGKDLLEALRLPEDTKRLHKGAGCAACHHTGTRGRTGIFEILEVTPKVRALILADGKLLPAEVHTHPHLHSHPRVHPLAG